MHPLLESCFNGGGPEAFYEAGYDDQLAALIESADPAEVVPRNCGRCGSETDPQSDFGVCPGCKRGTWIISLYDGRAFERTKHSRARPQKFPSGTSQKKAFNTLEKKGVLPPSVLALLCESEEEGWNSGRPSQAIDRVAVSRRRRCTCGGRFSATDDTGERCFTCSKLVGLEPVQSGSAVPDMQNPVGHVPIIYSGVGW